MRDITLVLGVDAKHLRQLSVVWPTWMRHKPELGDFPLLLFYDEREVTERAIRSVIGHREKCILFPWPAPGVVYGGDPTDKWYRPQRYKMLAGFVHVPAMHCTTNYWLKLDTDVVATGCPNWIQDSWFVNEPSIVSHRWGYTKPADQMLRLDTWVDENRDKLEMLRRCEPLRLAPAKGSSLVRHDRIISWCGFFHVSFTKFCSQWANSTIGEYRLPVPSQDGYLWYCAQRLGLEIKRTNMKVLGWQQWDNETNIRRAAHEAMGATA